jgi:hypothetical protein
MMIWEEYRRKESIPNLENILPSTWGRRLRKPTTLSMIRM